MTDAEGALPRLEPVFEVNAVVAAPQDLGATRAGHRRIVPILGGTVRGGLEGEILPGGADWQLRRDDGAVDIDCRYTARLTDGSLLYLQVAGVRSGPPEVLDSLLRGDVVSPDAYYFRTTLRIETSAPSHAHLQDAVWVASCVRTKDHVRYVAYRVT